MLGPRLACWRQSQNVSLAELAAHLGWSDAYLHLFERRSPGRRFKFSFYLAYSLCLGQPLSILFENERWPPLEPSLYALSPEATQQRQTEILQQVTRAVATLEAKQLPVTQVAICRQVGLSLVTLRRYPQVKAFLTTLAQHRRECRQEQTRRREQELLEQIPTIIATLQSQNRPVTYQAIADQVGLTPTTLNRYLRLHPLLAQVKQAYYQQPQQPLSDPVVPGPPANLVEQVREAIAALQAREQPVTQASLSQFLKWPRAWLRRHPDLVWLTEVYRQDAQTCRQRREQALVAQVQQAIISLTAQGHPLTQPAISQRVGLSVSSLINYPQVRHLLQQAIQFNQEQRRQQTRIREQQLLNRLNLAVIELQAGSTPITKRALSLKVGLSVSALQRYPWLKDRLNQVTKQSAP
jgi:transcriptional regulator with XRE-family HTH domain/AcrR family transcriptional regulator